jgi:hypothetical protein
MVHLFLCKVVFVLLIMLDVRYRIQKYKVQQKYIQQGRDGWHIFCGERERKERERGKARKGRELRRPKIE